MAKAQRCGKRIFFLYLLVSFLSAGLVSCKRNYEKKIILAGSNSVQPFAGLWAEVYGEKHPDVKVIVQGGGSSAGVEAVLIGISDIGMSSRELKPEEEFNPDGTKRLEKVAVAYDAIAVIANASSHLTDLTLDQLRMLFAGQINYLDGQRITVVTREEGSGTRKSFEEAIMKLPGQKTGERISNYAIVQDSNGAIRETVAGDPAAIGYISLGLLDKRVKALSVNEVYPSMENIRNKKYKLVRAFLFVMKNRNNRLAEDFIEFCLSDEGQELVAKKGLVKVKIIQ